MVFAIYPRQRRRYSVLFIQFLGVSENAPPITTPKIAIVAKISIGQDVLW